MNMRSAVFTFLASVAVCFAQAVNISGVVKNSSGTAISGAMVRLGKLGFSTTSGTDGKFALTGNITGVQGQYNRLASGSRAPCILEDGGLVFSVTEPTEVKTTVYDCNGRFLSSRKKSVTPSDRSLALPSCANGIHIYRVSVNDKQYTFESVTGLRVNRGTVSSSKRIAPAKQLAAAATMDDALLISQTGYQLYRLPVTNTDTTGIQATLSAWATGTVSDADGNSYQTIQYGKKVWAVENLRTTKYNDGSGIGSNYCFYKNATDAATKKKWGALYNGSAAVNAKLAPTGWHVSTSADWDTLQNYLIANGYNYDGTVSGNKIGKSMSATTDWKPDTFPGGIGNDLTKNNASGFSALPGGTRTFDGIFQDQNTMGYWWTSTPYDASYTNYRLINCTDVDLYKSYRVATNLFSIRIVKN